MNTVPVYDKKFYVRIDKLNMASLKGARLKDKDACLHCGKSVRPRQEALACDTCSRWQHRLCGTGMFIA